MDTNVRHIALEVSDKRPQVSINSTVRTKEEERKAGAKSRTHYGGRAVDIRIHGVPKSEHAQLEAEINAKYAPFRNDGKLTAVVHDPGPHLHIQVPKGGFTMKLHRDEPPKVIRVTWEAKARPTLTFVPVKKATIRVVEKLTYSPVTVADPVSGSASTEGATDIGVMDSDDSPSDSDRALERKPRPRIERRTLPQIFDGSLY